MANRILKYFSIFSKNQSQKEDDFLDMPLRERLSNLVSLYENPVFVTGYSLADQVIVHALQVQKLPVAIVELAGIDDGTLGNLPEITRERYDLNVTQSLPENAGMVLATDTVFESELPASGAEKVKSLPQVNPLKDWTEEQLVAYVLDHEVPVNPHDMPGFVQRAA